MKLLDLHTHHPVPQPEGIVSLSFNGTEPELCKDQYYSIGIHPWDTAEEFSEEFWKKLEEIASRSEVRAIGEAGIDLAGKGAALYRQLNIFKRQVELSESLGKPLIIHNVKAHDMIVGLRRDLKPSQNWAIHGFRGKPEVAEMLLRAGCYISFGQQFNRAALLAMPQEFILAETDESPLSIDKIIENLSVARETEMKPVVAENLSVFLNKP